MNPEGLDMELNMDKCRKGAGVLDYVTAWYIKQRLIFKIQKQKSLLFLQILYHKVNRLRYWESIMFSKYKIKIHFAHRTFKWGNEARGNAAVHVVIIGFAHYDQANKKVFLSMKI
jgi:hypothetical protein